MTTATTTQQHTARLDFDKLAPAVHQAMITLDAAANKHLDPVIAELVKIRASQLNHCAYCLDMHTRDARAQGESEQRVNLLPAWPETGRLFTERERAALALTEAVTVLTDGFVPDDVYARAAEHFDETELAHLIAAILTINAWNRIAVTTRKQVPQQ
ncbi:carboxymuconolactone decarboxylase family protein [Streptomyces sp. OF3]|uniref:Carboxymuconolactone decarboxylase family protein n=1 Tax=Streptomyces alkaliterrae TaxID=2213162 RepID=A0A7W3WRD2_9ACTN|nr:carboxymuconolactone decarboxylase family protein [Streptomyces alkaliterrae]MBB1257103.1 carboxymuconolactone decarboxylase family protein [Streptomyces alkaliterrae]